MKFTAICCLAVLSGASSSQAAMRITEWMYQGATTVDPEDPLNEAGEFIEFTNVGAAAIDMTGWTYDDDSRDPAQGFDLSPFGVVLPGESVVITDWSGPLFRNAWGLGAEVKVIGFSAPGLGRNDEINLYDSNDLLVDRFTYGDQNIPGSLRTRGFSGNIPVTALGANDALAAVESVVGDAFGSFQTSRGLGNPGSYPSSVIPEPSTTVLLVIAGAGLAYCRR